MQELAVIQGENTIRSYFPLLVIRRLFLLVLEHRLLAILRGAFWVGES